MHLLHQPHRIGIDVVFQSSTGRVAVEHMAVTSNAVFLFQEFLRRLGRGLAVIQGSDPKAAAGKAGTAPKDMIYFFIRNRKCRGLCLCTGWCFRYIRFLILPVDCFNLLCFRRKLKADLDSFRFSVAQA